MAQERKLGVDRGETVSNKVTVRLDAAGKPQIVAPERKVVEATEPPPVAPHATGLDPLKHATWLAGGGG